MIGASSVTNIEMRGDNDPSDLEDQRKAARDLEFWQHALCGSTAGVVEHLVLFPLDTLKTRLQSKLPTRYMNLNPSLAAAAGQLSAKHKKTPKIFRNLFKGSNAIVMGCIPAHLLYFTTYEFVKKNGSVAAAGAVATVCHDVILTPADVIKQRLQLGLHSNSLHCFLSLIRQEGIRSLFRSLSVTLFMNIPYHVALVSVNESLKRFDGSTAGEFSTSSYFFYAGVGGAIAGALTNPLDVVKTRLQTQEIKLCKSAKRCVSAYFNPISAARIIFRQDGFRGFWKGTVARIGMCIPAAAISWGTYEVLKGLF